jgi:hypothetical protein
MKEARQLFENNIDLTQYPEKCRTCGAPARTELCVDDSIGVEWFQFCINPKCVQFDAWLVRKRQEEEAKARQSAAFKREQAKLWKLEIRRMKRQQRKLRTALAKL